MAARLIFREKHVYFDGAIVEMVIWRLPCVTKAWPHGLKYRLYCGRSDGLCLVRYDNERGKGDHRHLPDDIEVPYTFVDVETLVADFLTDVSNERRSIE